MRSTKLIRVNKELAERLKWFSKLKNLPVTAISPGMVGLDGKIKNLLTAQKNEIVARKLKKKLEFSVEK